jgi:hypothetical protein
MSSNPTTPAEAAESTEADELRPFADRWQIEMSLDLGVWTADYESADVMSRRVVVGRSASELAGKLRRIEQAAQ